MQWKRYQLQPPHVWFIPQVLLEVEATHILVDQTEGACVGQAHSQERYCVHISIVKEVININFLGKPLHGICQ